MCSIILIKFYLAHMCTTRIHNKGVSININSQFRSMRCRNKLLSIGIYSQRTAKQPITNALNFFSSTIFAVHFATNGKNQQKKKNTKKQYHHRYAYFSNSNIVPQRHTIKYDTTQLVWNLSFDYYQHIIYILFYYDYY